MNMRARWIKQKKKPWAPLYFLHNQNYVFVAAHNSSYLIHRKNETFVF